MHHSSNEIAQNTDIPCISYNFLSQYNTNTLRFLLTILYKKNNQLTLHFLSPPIPELFSLYVFISVFVLPIPTYLAFLVPSHPGIGAGRGLDQRKSPTGGNAYGRDLHRREYDAVVLIGDDEEDDEEKEGEEPESRIGKTISAS